MAIVARPAKVAGMRYFAQKEFEVNHLVNIMMMPRVISALNSCSDIYCVLAQTDARGFGLEPVILVAERKGNKNIPLYEMYSTDVTPANKMEDLESFIMGRAEFNLGRHDRHSRLVIAKV